jgi:hypothetical protein
MAKATDDNTSIDVLKADSVEIAIGEGAGGARIWLHIDGALRVRIYRIGRLLVDDRRPGSRSIRELTLVEGIRHVLARCSDAGGEIDGELVAELKAAVGGVS